MCLQIYKHKQAKELLHMYILWIFLKQQLMMILFKLDQDYLESAWKGIIFVKHILINIILWMFR